MTSWPCSATKYERVRGEASSLRNSAIAHGRGKTSPSIASTRGTWRRRMREKATSRARSARVDTGPLLLADLVDRPGHGDRRGVLGARVEVGDGHAVERQRERGGIERQPAPV